MGLDVTEVHNALKGASCPASSDDLAQRAAADDAASELVIAGERLSPLLT